MTIKIPQISDNKTNGYYILSENNAEFIRNQLNRFGFIRYDTLPSGGVKFNWISRRNDIDWTTFDTNFQILNHISNEEQLSNKGLLLINLRHYENNILKTNRIDTDYLSMKNFLPETYLLDNITDRIQFEKIFHKGSTWISKPVGLSCGREIFIFRSKEHLNRQLNAYHQNARNYPYCTMYYNRLVQKYIDNPLLIHKHKFDIRTYLLCISTSKEMLCFASQIGYLRLSMYEFNLDDMNQLVHLTNQSIQIKNKDFVSRKNETGMTMKQFNEYFNQYIQPNISHIEKDWVLDQLPKKITKILSQVADSVRNKLFIREGCFAFYGVDILIDDKLNCWLLEINSGPTLDMTNIALEEVIPKCLNEAINLVITSLENYRSLGSAFPLCQSDIFTYLPPSNYPIRPTIISTNNIPIFTSTNNRRINLTPGVIFPVRRYRRSSSLPKSPRHFSKSSPRKIEPIEKQSKPVRSNRQTIVHNLKVKLSREDLSHQLTELIQSNQKSLIEI